MLAVLSEHDVRVSDDDAGEEFRENGGCEYRGGIWEQLSIRTSGGRISAMQSNTDVYNIQKLNKCRQFSFACAKKDVL
jgi:hypothetical protein